jgi:hypothetical protein
MAIAEDDLKRISIVIAEQIRAQFDKGCLCGLKPHALSEMGHFWGMMEDVGDGKPEKSVEALRTVIRTQRRIEMASSKAAIVVVTVVATAACYGAWNGLKSVWRAAVQFANGG